MSDVTLQNFESEVIEASRQAPVLVDFWAHGAVPAARWARCWKIWRRKRMASGSWSR